jgi:hypothetical protein
LFKEVKQQKNEKPPTFHNQVVQAAEGVVAATATIKDLNTKTSEEQILRDAKTTALHTVGM